MSAAMAPVSGNLDRLCQHMFSNHRSRFRSRDRKRRSRSRSRGGRSFRRRSRSRGHSRHRSRSRSRGSRSRSGGKSRRARDDRAKQDAAAAALAATAAQQMADISQQISGLTASNKLMQDQLCSASEMSLKMQRQIQSIQMSPPSPPSAHHAPYVPPVSSAPTAAADIRARVKAAEEFVKKLPKTQKSQRDMLRDECVRLGDLDVETIGKITCVHTLVARLLTQAAM